MIAPVRAFWCASISAGVDRASMGGICFSADRRSSTYSSISCWNLRSVSASISVVCGGAIVSLEADEHPPIATDPSRARRRSTARSRIIAGNLSWRASLVHDLVPLLLENLHPVVDRRLALALRRVDLLLEALDAGGREHVAELSVGELDEQVGEELPPRLADSRMDEGAAQRLLLVGHALAGVLPHGLGLPRVQVDPRVVEQRRLAEGQSDVMDVHERLLAVFVALFVFDDAVGEADEPLIAGLAVAVLQEHGEQLQGVALRPWRAPHAFVDPVQLRPRPSLELGQRDLLSLQLALDARDPELALGHLALAAPEPGLDRTVAARHLDRIVALRAEADGPEQPARRHLGVDLAAVVLDLHDVPAAEVAQELRRVARQFLVRGHVVASHLLVRLEAPLPLRSPEQVHGGDPGRLPDGRAPDVLGSGLRGEVIELAGTGRSLGVSGGGGG